MYTLCVHNVRNVHKSALVDGDREVVYEGGSFDFINIAYLERCLSKNRSKTINRKMSSVIML